MAVFARFTLARFSATSTVEPRDTTALTGTEDPEADGGDPTGYSPPCIRSADAEVRGRVSRARRACPSERQPDPGWRTCAIAGREASGLDPHLPLVASSTGRRSAAGFTSTHEHRPNAARSPYLK
jgi:hypothetical protein